MNKSQKIALFLASLSLLSGCASSNNDEEVVYETNYEETNLYKEFEVGTHLIEYVMDYDNSLGYAPAASVPDGYSVVDIELATKRSSYGSKTDKILFFFINDEAVEVQGVIDEKTGEVVYPNPGTPVSKSLVLEKDEN